MMGHRSRTNAEERDAFSKRSRRLLQWRPGELGRIKRQFGKKHRRTDAERVLDGLREVLEIVEGRAQPARVYRGDK